MYSLRFFIFSFYESFKLGRASRLLFKALWVEVFLLLASLVLVRISILLFYRRIFATPWFEFAVWVFVVVLVSWGIACIIVWPGTLTRPWEEKRTLVNL